MSQPTDPHAATTDVRSLEGATATTPPTGADASSSDADALASLSNRASAAPTDTGAPVVEGDILAEKYKIERVLGQGGIGVVVAAMHLRLKHRVAIKFLLPGASDEAIERFSREAQSAMKLKSEHATKVLDVGELPNGAPYMVLEFLQGSDLAEHLTWHGPLPTEDAVEYVLQACEAMAEAHAAGIIHRDLKPANLFLTQTGGRKIIKVLDFGISKAAGDAVGGRPGMSLTKTTAVFGSPMYMPPEQMRSARDVDARSDIWSLGVILYELVTGRPPFDAELYPDLVMKISIEPAPPPSSIRKNIPSKLEAAILRCLEKRPAARFQDIAQLAIAIAPFARANARGSVDRIQKTLEAVPPSTYIHEGPQVSPPAASSATTDNASRSTSPAKSSNALLLKVVAATVAGSAALVLGVAAMLGLFKAPEPSTNAAPITPAIEATTSATNTNAAGTAKPPIGVTPAGEAATQREGPKGATIPAAAPGTALPKGSTAPQSGSASPSATAGTTSQATQQSPPPSAALAAAPPPSTQTAAPPPPTAPPPPPTTKKNPLDMEIK